MSIEKEIKTFHTSREAHIYQIPLEVFPGFWSYAYLVKFEDFLVLIDVGSGIGDSSTQLLTGIEQIDKINPSDIIEIEELTHVLITHGHIDHFGGLAFARSKTNARIGIHELDLRNVTNFEERRTLLGHKLREYLIQSGVPRGEQEDLLEFNRLMKQLFQSVPIDFTYEAIGMKLGPFDFLHVPGHSAGHVVIRLHDVLFCGDHILSDITPHQSPEQITAWAGLGHYLQSLKVIEEWAEETNLALCGHEEPVVDLSSRIDEIRGLHNDRLGMVLNFFTTPKTINELKNSMFANVNGFNALLAIEEAGAHVEYLYQRGDLKIENFDEIDRSVEPCTYYYTRQ